MHWWFTCGKVTLLSSNGYLHGLRQEAVAVCVCVCVFVFVYVCYAFFAS